MIKRLTCLLFLTLIGLSAARAATEVITLDNRLAAEVLPVAQTVLGERGRATAYGNQLIVNAPPEVLAELRQALQQVDRAPRQLRISVDTRDYANQRQNGYTIDGNASVGEDAYRRHQSQYPRIIRRQTATSDSGIQQVQATEGYPALIQVGEHVPLQTTSTDRYGRVYQDVEYRNALQGFYATATLVGDRVQIALSTRNDRVSASRRDVIELQGTETRVSGRVGEWIDVGSISEDSSLNRSGYRDHYSTQSGSDLSIRLKVEVLD